MSITGGGLDLENTLRNSEERDIKSSSAEIENEDVSLPNNFVETVGDGSGGGKNVHTRDGTSILCHLTLRVIEAGRDSDGCVVAGCPEVRLGRSFFR